MNNRKEALLQERDYTGDAFNAGTHDRGLRYRGLVLGLWGGRLYSCYGLAALPAESHPGYKGRTSVQNFWPDVMDER